MAPDLLLPASASALYHALIVVQKFESEFLNLARPDSSFATTTVDCSGVQLPYHGDSACTTALYVFPSSF